VKHIVHTKGGTTRAGFTLLEILLAMGILLFGMSAILGLLTFGSALSRTAQLRTNAAMAVESVTADLEETFFPIVNGEAGEPRAIERRQLPGAATIVYSAVPHQNPDRPLEYRVDVEIAWKSAGVQREKRFTTLLLREVPFGERLRRRFVEGEPIGQPNTSEPTGAAEAPRDQAGGARALRDQAGGAKAPSDQAGGAKAPRDEAGAADTPRGAPNIPPSGKQP